LPDPGAALATSDAPQWILVLWDGNIATDPIAKQLHDASVAVTFPPVDPSSL